MTTMFELAIGLFAVSCGIWYAWDTWREQRRQEARRQRWEALATQLDRYRAHFQGDFPRTVTVRDGDGLKGQYEIRRRPDEPIPPQPGAATIKHQLVSRGLPDATGNNS
ncbi:MAG TPA: hypothetical protein VMG10_12240 [Gemmataceae bacterium]|nr:hypothetical protein [Gemmataceae bacterium]